MPSSHIPSTISSRPPHHHSGGPPVYDERRLLDRSWARRGERRCWRRRWLATRLWVALDQSRQPLHGEMITSGRRVGAVAHLASVKGRRTGADSSGCLLHTTGKEVQALSQNTRHGKKRIFRNVNQINALTYRTSTAKDSCKITKPKGAA